MQIFKRSKLILSYFLFPFTALLLLISPYFNHTFEKMSAGLAVLSGILLSFIFTNPYLNLTKKLTPKLLTLSVVGLGFGMNLITVAKVGVSGLGTTFLSIAFTTTVGLGLGRLLKTSTDTSVLVTFGTAICGGSAIAAISPAINAKPHEVSVSLAIVFLLNAISLFIFPSVGHLCHLSQHEFGLWSALAIHDTSSVVGATLQYGKEALEVGTTVKLARALWIIPITFLISFFYSKYVFKNKTSHQTLVCAETQNQVKLKKPWFILGFLLAAALVTFLPALKGPGLVVHSFAEKMLVLTLFCIGSNMSPSAVREVGIKPFVQGVLLWVVTASVMLLAIIYFFK